MKVKTLFKEILFPGNQNDINDYIVKNDNVYMPSDVAQYNICVNQTYPVLLQMNWMPCGYVGDEVLTLDSSGQFFGDATLMVSGHVKTVRTTTLNTSRFEVAQTNFELDSLDFIKMPISGTCKVKIETNGIGKLSGHAYVNNIKWYKLYDFKTDTVYANPILIASNINHVIVNEKGVYGYVDDGVNFGYFQVYIK